MAPRLFVCFGRARGGGGRKVSSAASTASDANSTADLTVEEQRQTGPVLVELFSSQGCGSSPEAEVVASRLGQGNLELEGEGEVPPAVVLAFHVEYWDYRGWKDPFGSSTWTVRQKAYVDALRLDTLYTPQLVVNGRSQCVGNDLDAVSAAVRSAPRFPSPAMQATFEVPSPDTLEVSFTGSLRTKIDGSGADVSVALYESGLVTNCENGENKGRVLANDYVVRRLEKLLSVKDVSANKSLSGTVSFDIWEGFNASKSGLVLFIQNASMQIFGVQRFPCQLGEPSLFSSLRVPLKKMDEWARGQTSTSLVEFASREVVEGILNDISERVQGIFQLYSRFSAIGLFRVLK